MKLNFTQKLGLVACLALVVGMMAACGGGSSTPADGGMSGRSARELCMEALASPGSCLSATGSTQADCEEDIGDAIAAGCRAETEASLSCLNMSTPDPSGYCSGCETQQMAVSACLTR